MEGSLICPLNLEWTNSQGIVTRKLTHKKATIRLIRDTNSRLIFVEVTAEKCASVRLLLKSVQVHNRFMKEGKATVKFLDDRCTLMLSNAPPAALQSFLKTMFVKMTGEKQEQGNTSLRSKILLGKTKQFDEISPLTTAEINVAINQISKKTDTTPSPSARKRKHPDDKSRINEKAQPPSKKKLYSNSPVPPHETLNEQQREVYEACLAGHNVFFTGSAGTGKSFLLRKIIAALPPDVTVATASTGVAACHIGGITLHQFAGIGSGEAGLERCYELASRPAQTSLWKKCKHLVIDEISMVEGSFFQKIEAVARRIRRSDKPFGGIQLIICGDFFQLPPVSKPSTLKSTAKPSQRFCFQTEAWDRCIKVSFDLTIVHRQQDREFVDILNSVRLGRVPPEMAQRLRITAKQDIEQDGILATRLCSHTDDVRGINEGKLKELQGQMMVFEAQDSDPALLKYIDQGTSVPRKLELKIGSQVMLLKNVNISQGLVNGARGVIKAFVDSLPLVRFRSTEYLVRHERWVIRTASGVTLTRRQVPLQLAWAFSIHKAQGLTLDCVEMALGRVFEAGQAYVALSRAMSLHTLRVLDFKESQVWADPDVLSFYKKLTFRTGVMRIVPLGSAVPKKKKEEMRRALKSNKPIMTIS